MNIKHTIIMMTYNHEEYIEKALDSALNQKVKPYEILIGNDCSKDNTHLVILKYLDKYPEIIKYYNHETNLGIYQNINFLIEKASGDMIHILAGDDWIEGEMFEEFNKLVFENGLNCQNDSFMIMPNFYRYENEQLNEVDNYKYGDVDYPSLKIKNLASNREMGLSAGLLKKIGLFDLSVGLWADWLFGVDHVMNADKIVFTDKAFPVYRVGVGIAFSTKEEILLKSYLKVIDKIFEKYSSSLKTHHRHFLMMQKHRTAYKLNNNFLNFSKYLLFFTINLYNFNSLLQIKNEIKNFISHSLKNFIKSRFYK